MSCIPTTVSCRYTTHDTNTHVCFSENVTSDDLQRTFPLDWSVGYYPKMCRTLCMKQRRGCLEALKGMHNIRERERETYLGMGEKMLSPARNFLMVPPALNQLCRFSCCALRNSLLRCFHCCEVNVLRILSDKNKESEAKRGRNVSEHAGVHYHFVGVKITIKCLYLMHLSISGISDAA